MWNLSAYPTVQAAGPQPLAIQRIMLVDCEVGLRLRQGLLELARLSPFMLPIVQTETIYIRRPRIPHLLVDSEAGLWLRQRFQETAPLST